MPSVVSFTSNDRLIGESAVNASINNPKNTVFGVKRLIGRKYVALLSINTFQIIHGHTVPRIFAGSMTPSFRLT
jgi:molecular chaperone DnaK (HSP70)